MFLQLLHLYWQLLKLLNQPLAKGISDFFLKLLSLSIWLGEKPAFDGCELKPCRKKSAILLTSFIYLLTARWLLCITETHAALTVTGSTTPKKQARGLANVLSGAYRYLPLWHLMELLPSGSCLPVFPV